MRRTSPGNCDSCVPQRGNHNCVQAAESFRRGARCSVGDPDDSQLIQAPGLLHVSLLAYRCRLPLGVYCCETKSEMSSCFATCLFLYAWYGSLCSRLAGYLLWALGGSLSPCTVASIACHPSGSVYLPSAVCTCGPSLRYAKREPFPSGLPEGPTFQVFCQLRHRHQSPVFEISL